MLRKARGFTLIELLLSLTALTLVLQGFYSWKSAAMEDAAIQRTVDGFILIDEAAYVFHMEQLRWPTSLVELRDPLQPLLPPIPPAGFDPVTNGVGGEYRLSVIPPDLGIRVETTMQTHEQALRVQRSFPARTEQVAPGSATVAFVQRVAPKDSTEHELLVWRDGRHAMTGNLNFDGFQARNMRRLGFRNGDTVGSACTGRDISSDFATGQLLECPLATLQWRPVGAGSDVECLWSGWEPTAVVSWWQSGDRVVPSLPGLVNVSVAWCDGNGRITHVDVVSCSASGRVGYGIPTASNECISGLAPP